MDIEFHPVPKPTHKRKNKKRVDRGKFSSFIREQVKEHFQDTCQMCGGHGFHLHHVCFRSQGGRGVFSNALLLCNICHKRVHEENELAMYWREKFKKKYGPLYYMDKEDLEYKQFTQEIHQDDKSLREWKKYNAELDLKSMVSLAEASDQRRDESR
jgi:hypothetical protein